MPKLLNSKDKEFWVDVKKWHFGIAPDPFEGKDWDYETLDRTEILEELALARGLNIINSNNIDILNNSIIELRKEIKKLKSKIKKQYEK